MLKILSFAVICSVGCAQGVPIPEGALDFAKVILTPATEDITPVVVDWAARWSAATGLGIEVGTGGAIVELTTTPLLNPTDPTIQDCGQTVIHGGLAISIELDSRPRRDCPGWIASLGHEMGHAIEHSGKHSLRGLMKSSMAANTPIEIDAESLSLICDTADCLQFNPEN